MSNFQIQGNGNKVKGDSNKTKITISISTVLIVIIAIIFFSTSNSLEKKIVGTWQLAGTENLFEFTKDGDFIYLTEGNGGATITYNINNEKIYINISILWGSGSVIADVDISGNTMTLSNFVDPDYIFEVDSDDVWVLKKVN